MSTDSDLSSYLVNGTRLAYRVRAEVASQGITMAIFSAACFGASQSFLSGLLCRLESGGSAIQPKGALLRHTRILSNFLKQLLPQRINAYQTVIRNHPQRSSSLTAVSNSSTAEHLAEKDAVTTSLKQKVLELFCARVSMRPSALDVSILADVLNMETELVHGYFADARISMQREVLSQRATTLFVDVQKEAVQSKVALNGLYRDQAVQVGGNHSSSSSSNDLLTQALLSSGLSDVVAGTYTPQPCRVVYLPRILPLWITTEPYDVKEPDSSYHAKVVNPSSPALLTKSDVPIKQPSVINKLMASFRSIKPRDSTLDLHDTTTVPLPRKRRRRITEAISIKKTKSAINSIASETRVEPSSPTHDLIDLDVESLFSGDVEAFLRDAAGVDLSEILLGSMTEIDSQDTDMDAEQDAAVRTLLRSSISTPPLLHFN